MRMHGIKINVTLEQLLYDLRLSLNQNGINLLNTIKPIGDNIMVTCPSHKGGLEHKPSCGISTQDKYKDDKVIPAGTVHCFTCGYTASLTEFISLCFGYKDGGLFGNKWLKTNYGFLPSNTRKVQLNIGQRRNTRKELETLSEELLEGYRYTVDYMYKRGLTDDIIEQFDIGYDRKDKAITIPVPDLRGDVKWIQKRLIRYKQYLIPEGITKTDYLLGASEILKQHRNRETVYIVESPFNMLTCWENNIPAICLFGTGGGNQYNMLKELPIRHYVIALDPDEAGRKGSRRLVNELSNHKILSKLCYQDSRDINELGDELQNLEKKLINF